MNAETQICYVGIDVSKGALDYALTPTEEGQELNTDTGHRRLVERLRQVPHARVVCEATGGYERPVVAALLAAGVEVCVVQPGRARAYAQSEGLLAKTDRIDAQSLRRYGQNVTLRLAQPTPEKLAVLRDLLDRRRDVVERLVELENQLGTARKTLREWLERELRFLKKERDALDQAVKKHVAADEQLRVKEARLRELKGAGPILAATLLAYLPELGSLPDKTISALAGVAPHPRDSGKTRRPRHVRGGRAALRHVLYMAAVAAVRFNPILRAVHERLRAKGKPGRVCLVAIMRKMLVVLNRMLANPNFCLVQ